jgi:uracil-DNA glycosylase family 4
VAKKPGNEDALRRLKGYTDLLKYSNVKHIIGEGNFEIESGFTEAGKAIEADDKIESVTVENHGSTFINSGSSINPSESHVQSQDKPIAKATVEDVLPSSLELFSLSDEAAGYADFAALKETALKCTSCVLANGRTHVVFGEGAPDAKLMFIGEGPGEQEDLKARPFVGRAGQLLDKMIAAMGYKREEVYIANIVKCRPPQNRAPLPEEAISCLPYLRAQISFIKPKIIVLLGAVAVKFLLQTNAGISQVRGKFLDYHGYTVMPTFHPAFLLRSPGKKKEAWEDLKKVMTLLKES